MLRIEKIADKKNQININNYFKTKTNHHCYLIIKLSDLITSISLMLSLSKLDQFSPLRSFKNLL